MSQNITVFIRLPRYELLLQNSELHQIMSYTIGLYENFELSEDKEVCF